MRLRVPLFAFLSVLLSAGCDCEPLSSDALAVTPVFDVRVGDVTRSFVETVETSLRSGFRLAGLVNGYENRINTDVVYDNGVYRLSEPCVWPSSSYMDFYAVYPPLDIVEDISETHFRYVSDGSTDLVTARTPYVRMTDGPVLLTFSHVLSRVGVSVRGEEPEVSYTVEGIYVTVPEGGVFTFRTAAWNREGSVEIPLFAGDSVVSSDYALMGGGLTALPGLCRVRVDWVCRQSGEVVSRCSFSDDVNLEMGKLNVIRVTLTAHGRPVSLVVSVDDWDSNVVSHRL